MSKQQIRCLGMALRRWSSGPKRANFGNIQSTMRLVSSVAVIFLFLILYLILTLSFGTLFNFFRAGGGGKCALPWACVFGEAPWWIVSPAGSSQALHGACNHRPRKESSPHGSTETGAYRLVQRLLPAKRQCPERGWGLT